MRLTLIVLGCVVVFGALCRAAHLGQRGLWVRMVMVLSWAILAVGVTLLQVESVNKNTLLVRLTFGVGIVLGAASFLAARITHGRGD